jgi:hypothetical protein
MKGSFLFLPATRSDRCSRTSAQGVNGALRQDPHSLYKHVISPARCHPQCRDARNAYGPPPRYPCAMRPARAGDGSSRYLWSRGAAECQSQRSPAANAAGPESCVTDRARGRGSRREPRIHHGLDHAPRAESVWSGVPRHQQSSHRQYLATGGKCRKSFSGYASTVVRDPTGRQRSVGRQPSFPPRHRGAEISR